MKKIPSPDEEMKIMECGLSAWKMQGIVSSLSICNWGFKHISKKSCVSQQCSATDCNQWNLLRSKTLYTVWKVYHSMIAVSCDVTKRQ